MAVDIIITVPTQTQITQVAVPGIQGPPGIFAVGNVVTGAPGTSAAIATRTRADGAQLVDFTIPRGDVGASNVIGIGTVTTGAAGSAASATMTGTSPNQTLNLTIPQGAVGAAGTITGATATSLAVGATPTVTLGGTTSARTFAFGIPTGATGATGPANTLTIGTVTTGAAGSSAAATITGTAPNQTLNLTIPTGPQGPTGAGASDATTLAKGSIQLAGDLGGTAALPTVVSGASHSHTKAQVGLGNVDNTSDANKPVSTAQQTAFNAKADLTASEAVKVHDGTAGGGTRPTGYYRVRWVGGTVRPTNMVAGDIWEHDA